MTTPTSLDPATLLEAPAETPAAIAGAEYDEHGRLCGLAKYYGDDGQLVQQAAYYNNKLHGTVTQYHPNGMVREVASYQEHRLHGDVITYAPDGSIVAHRHFRDGKPCDASTT